MSHRLRPVAGRGREQRVDLDSGREHGLASATGGTVAGSPITECAHSKMGYTTLVEAAKVAEAVNADAKISVSVDQSDAGSKAPTPSHGFPRYSRCCTTRDGWMNSGVAIESGRDIVPTESRQSDLAKAVIRRTDMDLLFGSCAVAYGHLVCTEALASTGK